MGSYWTAPTIKSSFPRQRDVFVFEQAEAEGEISVEDPKGLIETPMAQWLADGWITAELTNMKMDKINMTTATFKSKWLDSYKDGETETSCGWYLANWLNGAWAFTAYADIDCHQHGL